MAQRRSSLIVFLKAPRPGQVKTRLAAELGPPAALRIYRAMAEHTIAATAPLETDHYDQTLCFSPPGSRDEIAAWFPGRILAEQQGTDLGERMAHALSAAFREGAKRAVLVGTDVPQLTRSHVQEAFGRLDKGRADVVVGPTFDGGYYLIGSNCPQPGLFTEMPWSTPEVLPRTLARAAALRLRLHRLEDLRDVDTAADLRACAERLPAGHALLSALVEDPEAKGTARRVVPDVE